MSFDVRLKIDRAKDLAAVRHALTNAAEGKTFPVAAALLALDRVEKKLLATPISSFRMGRFLCILKL